MLRRTLQFGPAIAALAWLGATGVAPARGDFTPTLTVAVTQQGGLYTYDYTVNNSRSTLGVSGVDVGVFFAVPLTSFTAPSGFLANVNSDPTDRVATEAQFFSTDPTTDIQPGATASFSLVSAQAPELAPYVLRNIDAAAGTVTETPAGQMILSPVPEPSSLLLGVVGALGLSLAGYGRGRRKASA